MDGTITNCLIFVGRVDCQNDNTVNAYLINNMWWLHSLLTYYSSSWDCHLVLCMHGLLIITGNYRVLTFRWLPWCWNLLAQLSLFWSKVIIPSYRLHEKWIRLPILKMGPNPSAISNHLSDATDCKDGAPHHAISVNLVAMYNWGDSECCNTNYA